MKGLFKVGTMLALVGGVTALAAMVAPPAQAYDHCWYHERAARAYWHHERWLADHSVYPAYVVPRYAAVPIYAPAPVYRRVIY